MKWVMNNWNNILSVVSALLAVTVSVLHMQHKDSVAASFQELQSVVRDLQNQQAQQMIGPVPKV